MRRMRECTEYKATEFTVQHRNTKLIDSLRGRAAILGYENVQSENAILQT
jgi:hypothetical protein